MKWIYESGEKALAGTYWSPVSGRVYRVKRSRTLPGKGRSPFLKVPGLLIALVAPLIGLAYVIVLPFVGFVVVAWLLLKKLYMAFEKTLLERWG